MSKLCCALLIYSIILPILFLESRLRLFILDVERRNILEWYDPDSSANIDDVSVFHTSCSSTSKDFATRNNVRKLSVFSQIVYRYRRVSCVKANSGKSLSSHVVSRRREALLHAPNLRQTSANLLGSVSHERIKTILSSRA
jgi:hypothetical protein